MTPESRRASPPQPGEGRFIWISAQEYHDWSYAVDVTCDRDGIASACETLLQRYRDAKKARERCPTCGAAWWARFVLLSCNECRAKHGLDAP